MAKIVGIGMIVLGVWIGMEIFTKGMDSAFGGLFAFGSGGAAREAAAPPSERIRARVGQNFKAGAARTTDALGEASLEEIEAGEEIGDE